MVIIPKGLTFCAGGAVAPNSKETNAIIHAMIEERDRVVGAGGNQYGELSIEEFTSMIAAFRRYQIERGD